MISRTKLNLKHRLTLIGVLVALLPFPFLAILSRSREPITPPPFRPGLTAADLDHFADSSYQAVDFSRRELSRTLSIAGSMVANDRGVKQIKARQVVWPVAGGHPVKLPLLSIRKTLLLPSANPRRAFVTEFNNLSGAQCSIFQRMNGAGDMLWVATSLSAPAGEHTVGTVIPATAPAAKAVLDKHSYIGLVVMAGERNFAGFEPISRTDGAIIGMLGISLPETAEVEAIRQALSRIKAGSRGELFAGATGLPISAAALPEVMRAARAQPVKAIEARYHLASEGNMVAHVRYFAPWDWLVGVAVPESEMAILPVPLPAPADHTAAALSSIFLLTVALSAFVWWRSSRYLASPILAAQQNIRGNVDRLLAIAAKAAAPVPSTCKQEPLLARVSVSVSEASRISDLILTGVGETALSIRECQDHAEKASAELEAMQTATAELTSSNSQVSGLVKDIAGIALQSRLLALNASIEAARAGHHGTSFSVVADEFGKLAQRCSDNAKTTAALLTSSVAVSTASTEHLAGLGAELGQFSRRSEIATQSLTQLLEATNKQARAISSLQRSFGKVEKQEAPQTGLQEEIRAEAASLERNAEQIVNVITGMKRAKNAKPPVPKSRSFGAKAPAGSRSARRAY